MTTPDAPHWTTLTDEWGRHLCCLCRLHWPAHELIRWAARPPLGETGCWTCFACWIALSTEAKSAHRAIWRADG